MSRGVEQAGADAAETLTAPALSRPAGPSAAAEAGLRYVDEDEPGITRRRAGKGFGYRHPDGRPVREPDVLRRIRSLAVPPAYRDVWICCDADGHIQATGRDDRGRKQYRYHPRWRAVRDSDKYGRTLAFGQALPRIRERLEEDLARRGLPREKVLAGIVKLLEVSLIRVGNDEYAKANRSFGLTTLLDRHVDIDGQAIRFEFRAKSGKRQSVELRDRRLARIVKSCQDIPGQTLFQYYDGDGERHRVTSGDVNAYIRAVAGADFSAKDFRTWAGTVLAAMALQEIEAAEGRSAVKRNITRAVEAVAARLGNTPAVCRKCYVHPEVLSAYAEGTLLDGLSRQAEPPGDGNTALSGAEAAVLAVLKARSSDPSGLPGA